MHMHIISYLPLQLLSFSVCTHNNILDTYCTEQWVRLKMCFHPHPYFMFICHILFSLSCHRVLHSLSSTAIQRNSSNTSLIDSITLDTLVSNECIPSFNNCTVLSSSPFIPSSPTFINVASNSELRNRNLSKCNAAVKFNFSHSAFCSCVIAVVISVRWLLFLLSLFNNVDLTELIVSLNTENVAVTLAHNAGYVVIFPDSNMVDRPL